jgi:Tol biopolymer transport system component
MPRGLRHLTERIELHDHETGILVRQVTSFPTMHLHLHYETPTFTPDGKRMLFESMRGAYRTAPWDMYVMGTNGDVPTQLSGDAPCGVSSACMTVDGTHVLYMESGTCHRTNIDTAEDVEIGHVDGGGHHDYQHAMRSWDGRYYFSLVKRAGKVVLVRWNLQSGERDILLEADGMNHPVGNPAGPEMSIGPKTRQPDGSLAPSELSIWCFHCETLEEVDIRMPRVEAGTAHASWLGASGKYQGTLLWPMQGVVVMDPAKPEPELVATGSYFWHSSGSLDGEWIIADTAFPANGLWLINVATKKKERLCWSGSRIGHAQWTHPHPVLSHDGRLAAFGSNATGITQVYVVTVPEEMRTRLSTP